MPAPRKNAQADAMALFYEMGWSLAKIAKAFGVTRQAAHKMLARRSISMRHADPMPFIVFEGRKFSLKKNGYYRDTLGNREFLHRAMWESVHGPIPEGYDIHHRDGDKTNNTLGNFEMLTKEDHGASHGFGGNQHTGSLGTRPVR